MTIGLLAPPWLPVPPPAYGGTECVIDQLARGLVAAGHQVSLHAAQGSTCPVPTTYCSTSSRIGEGSTELAHVMGGYESLAGCNVIHDHTVLGPAWALAKGYGRAVTTCHGPLDGEFRKVYRRYGERLRVLAISRNQAARAPDVMIDRVIHHGVDTDRIPIGAGRGGNLLFLGRMAPGKGVREAALVARDAGARLVIAAKMREAAEREYFEREVEPLLGDGLEFVGEASESEKLALLGEAKALLNPLRWAEPFGLVMTEALACGTPVIACPRGAAPEIVDDGVTGFLARRHADLVRAVHTVDRIDRVACRTAAVDRFSTTRMVSDHLALYGEMAGH
jgi:glycosyltransferase involved in cell wall biosynthesis